MNNNNQIVALLFFLVSALPLPAQYYNVKEFGVKGEGEICTREIQQAIDAAAMAGGGKVVIPAGKYISGPLFLRSNLTIEILSGAVVYFNNNITSTPVIDGSWEGIERKVYASLFTGHDLENVTITGKGQIDGQGQVWWDAYLATDKMRVASGIREREPENPPGSPLPYPRPRMINLYNCENVLISDILITNSPSWTIHPVYCRNVNIQGISILQPYESPNTDGINPESCNGVRISNCFVDCGDDCITIKSGYNEHGRNKAVPCENITIMNCTFAHGRSAVGIGSEMSGGVRNVTVMNCVFNGTLRGLRVKTGRGRGGTVENLLAIGIVMENLREGISIDMGYEGAGDQLLPVTEETPRFKNIRYSHITGSNIQQAINIIGLPESMPRDIVLENIRLECERGLVCRYANGLTLRNVELYCIGKTAPFSISRSHNLVLDNIRTRYRKEIPAVDLTEVRNTVVGNCVLPQQEENWFISLHHSDPLQLMNNLLYDSIITNK